MKIYLDTSSLFKLYKSEKDSEDVEKALYDNKLTAIFLSQITKLEFISAVFKRLRMKDLSIAEAKKILGLFENDTNKYRFVAMDKAVLDFSGELISKHGIYGLRTLDYLTNEIY